MKSKYILGAIAVAAVCLFAGCEKDPVETHLKGLELSSTYISIPTTGGSATVTLKADKAWAFDFSDSTGTGSNRKALYSIPDWLTVSPQEGESGEATLTFSAEAVEYGRSQELKITSGSSYQFLTVIQGTSTPEESTCAEVIAGPDSKQYIVTGTVTSISNTTYGNWNLQDATGEIYIYGTLDSNGGTKNFLSLGLEVGDVVTVQGPKTTYNGTVELVDVTVLKIVKSLLKLDKTSVEVPKEGGEFTLAAAYKGKIAYVNIPEDAQSWIVLSSTDYAAGVATFSESNPADTCLFHFTVLPNEGEYSRQTSFEVVSETSGNSSALTVGVVQDGSSYQALSLADFLAKEDDDNTAYQIGGIVTSIVMDKTDATKPNKFGNFYIKDRSAEAYIYGLLPEKGGAGGQDVISAKGIKVGDYIVLDSPKSSYNGSPQGKNAWYVSHYPYLSNAAFSALEDDATKSVFYTVSGTVTKIVMDKTDDTKPNKYGNIYINDGESELYIYGVLDWEGNPANFESLGVNVGDKITGYAYKSSYNGTIEAINLQPVLIESGEPIVYSKFELSTAADEVTYEAGAKTFQVVADDDVEWSVAIDPTATITIEGLDPNVFASSGTKNVTVNYTENTGSTSLVYTVTVSTENSNVAASSLSYTLTQKAKEPDFTTIAGLKALIATGTRDSQVSASGVLTDAVVTYVNGSNVFIEDASAGVLLYKASSGFEAGDKLDGAVSASGYSYSGLPELTSLDGATVTKGATIPLNTVTIADLISDDGYAKWESRRVKIEGATVETSIIGARKTSGKLSQNGSSVATYNQGTVSVGGAGDVVDVVTYLVSYNGTKQIYLYGDDDITLKSAAGVITVASTKSVTVGSTVELGATVNSGATLSYSSGNTDVATVSSDGVVTGVAEGSAVITITAPASGVYSAATATCTVTVVSSGTVEPTLQYTLDTTGSLQGSNNSYAGNCDITSDGITWNVTGNTAMNPWRIGGKNITNTDRAIYSKTSISSNISKIELTSGTCNATLNSVTVSVYSSAEDAAAGTNAIATFTNSTSSEIVSKTVTFEKADNASWAGCYYRVVYNLTAGSSNKYVQFSSMKFYGI